MKLSKSSAIILILFFSSACAHHPAPAPATDTLRAELDVISELKAGNARFVKHRMLHPRQDQARLIEMSAGQKPEAAIISCSDSRVPPEVIFDQGLGDIFSVRTAGQALDAYEVASIEYAVEHLGSKVIVIMGHSSCGAVQAAATTPVGKTTGSKNLDQLINRIRPGLKKYDPSDRELIQAAKNNVVAAAAYLKSKSPLIREELADHEVRLVYALYHLPTGEVEFW